MNGLKKQLIDILKRLGLIHDDFEGKIELNFAKGANLSTKPKVTEVKDISNK